MTAMLDAGGRQSNDQGASFNLKRPGSKLMDPMPAGDDLMARERDMEPFKMEWTTIDAGDARFPTLPRRNDLHQPPPTPVERRRLPTPRPFIRQSRTGYYPESQGSRQDTANNQPRSRTRSLSRTNQSTIGSRARDSYEHYDRRSNEESRYHSGQRRPSTWNHFTDDHNDEGYEYDWYGNYSNTRHADLQDDRGLNQRSSSSTNRRDYRGHGTYSSSSSTPYSQQYPLNGRWNNTQ